MVFFHSIKGLFHLKTLVTVIFTPLAQSSEHNLFKNSVYLKASLIPLIGLIGVME